MWDDEYRCDPIDVVGCLLALVLCGLTAAIVCGAFYAFISAVRAR